MLNRTKMGNAFNGAQPKDTLFWNNIMKQIIKDRKAEIQTIIMLLITLLICLADNI